MTDAFGEHRSLLFSIAYRMLGSVAEAEDLVQETYLRWRRQEAGDIVNAKAWLVAALTRLGIDQLRSARRRREEYVGVWLPEPIVDPGAPAPDETAAMADSLGMAFLVMLEELEPVERAVFLLREAFGQDYAEIAAIVDKSEASCRQIVSRAKRHFAQRKPIEKAAPAKAEAIVKRFMGAVATGELGDLLALLTDDAVLYTDGGGKVRSALKPIETADHVARFYLGIRRKGGLDGAAVEFIQVNGEFGAVMRRRDGVVAVTSFAFENDRIRAIYTVSNPDKLRHVTEDKSQGAV